MHDWLISGGSVADGLGSPLKRANIAITGRRLTLLPPDEFPIAARSIDATGHVVAPGFIDIHSHNDLVAVTGMHLNDKVSQGVTTEVIGNCGFSSFPLSAVNRPLLGELLGSIAPGKWAADWSGWRGFSEAVTRRGSQTNLIGQVGHGMLRSAVMGMDLRVPTDLELLQMQDLLAQCLDEGASGLSFGLMYHPSGFAERDEIRALCDVVADRNTFVSVHLRSYSDKGLMSGMEEMIWAAERSGARLQFSHLSPTGKRAQRLVAEMFDRVREASGRGIDIGFDRYPYEHAYSHLSLLFPSWALAGGGEAIVRRLEEEALTARLIQAIDEFVDDIGYDGIELSGELAAGYAGKTLQSIAEAKGLAPGRCVVELVREIGTSAHIVLKLSEDAVQERILAHDGCVVGSDGIACHGGTHPRTFGTFTKVLGPMVRKGVLSLPQAIHKMTGQPADWLGLTDRGSIRDDTIADLVVFDAQAISDQSTFADPYRLSSGIESVLVGGTAVVLNGRVTDALPGEVIRTRRTNGRGTRVSPQNSVAIASRTLY